MSTAVPTQSGRKFVDSDEFVGYQLGKARAGIRSADLVTAALGVAVLLLGYLIAFLVADQWLIDGGVSRSVRIVLVVSLLAVCAAWIVRQLVIPYLRQVSTLYAAYQIERSDPELHAALISLVDLQRSGRPMRPEVRAALERRAARRLAHFDVDLAVDRRWLMRFAYSLLVLVFMFCAYILLSPKPVGGSIWRAFIPGSDVAVATQTRIELVDPENTDVPARSQVPVRVHLSGEIPEDVTLFFSTEDRRLVDEPLALRPTEEDARVFSGIIAGENGRGLLQNISYRIEAGDAKAGPFTVTVRTPPSATMQSVTYEYPEYMNLADRTTAGGAVAAWEGTQVTFHAETNIPVASATLRFSDTEDTSVQAEEIPLVVKSGRQLSGIWRLQFREDGTYPHFYRITCRTEDGQTDPNPILYPVQIKPDRPPTVKVLYPQEDVELTADGELPLAFEAADPDFALRSVILRLEKDGERLAEAPRLFEAPPERQAVDGRYDLDLSRFNLAPGDVLTWWIEARDNMQPFGSRLGNRTNSDKRHITIVEATPEQPEDTADQRRAAAEEQLQQARDERRQQRADDQDRGQQDQRDEPHEGEPETGGQESDEQAGDNGTAGEREQTPSGDQQDGTNGDRAAGSDAENRRTDTGEPMTEQQSGDQTGDEATGGSETQTGDAPADGNTGSESTEPKAADDEALRRLVEEYRNDPDRQPQDPDSQESPGGQQQSPQENTSPNESGERKPEQSGERSGDRESGNETPPGNSAADPRMSEKGGGSDESAEGGTPESDMTGDSPSEGQSPNENPGQRPTEPGQTTTDQPQPSDSPTSEGTETEPSDGSTQPGKTEGMGETKPTQQPSDGGDKREGMTEDGTPRPTENSETPMNGTEPREGRPGDAPRDATPRPDPDAEPGDSPGEPRDSANQRPSDSMGEPRPESPMNDGSGSDSQPRPSDPSSTPRGNRPPQSSNPQRQQDSEDPNTSAPDGQSDPMQPGSPMDGSDSQSGSDSAAGTPQDSPGSAADGSQSKPGGQGQPGEQPEGSQPMDPGGSGATPEGGTDREGMTPPPDGSSQQSGSGEQSDSQDGSGNQSSGSDASDGSEGGSESSGGSQSQQQQSSDQPGQPSGSSGGSQPGTTGATGSAADGADGDAGSGTGTGDGGSPGSTPADLEAQKKAANLVLNRLKDDLERGEVSPELLEDLGWTEDELRRFAGELDERLSDPGIDNSPQAEARRRQFESILKGVDYGSRGARREAADGPRRSSSGFGSSNRPAPPEFRAAEEAFKRRLSRERSGR